MNVVEVVDLVSRLLGLFYLGVQIWNALPKKPPQVRRGLLLVPRPKDDE